MAGCVAAVQSVIDARSLVPTRVGRAGQGWWLALICAAWLIFSGPVQGRGYLRISRPSLINPDPQFRSPSAFSPSRVKSRLRYPAKPCYHSSRHDRIITTPACVGPACDRPSCNSSAVAYIVVVAALDWLVTRAVKRDRLAVTARSSCACPLLPRSLGAVLGSHMTTTASRINPSQGT